MYYTYILESISNGRLYIGQTKDLEARVERHNRNMNKSTKNRGPWKLLYNTSFKTRAEAVALERKLKGFKNPKKVKE